MKPKLDYLASRFPGVSETLVLFEVLELIKLRARVDIFPLLEEKPFVERICLFSSAIAVCLV